MFTIVHDSRKAVLCLGDSRSTSSCMGALTEREIFDQMNTSFRLAIEACDDLAVVPLKGMIYDKFRKQLRLIEGCCKQANTWREDTRWLMFIKIMAETHQRAGDWLRGFRMPDGTRVRITNGTLHPCFLKMAENLRMLHTLAEEIRTRKTGRVGAILPAPLAAPHRETRPVGFRRNGGVISSPFRKINSHPRVSSGGIILPESASVQ